MRSSRLRFLCVLTLSAAALLAPTVARAQVLWSGYAGNAQHTANSTVASQSLQQIIWTTKVDLDPQYSGTNLLVHYGSPLVTSANTVIVPVKTGATDGFRVEARNGTNGALIWQQDTDYSLPSHNWTPSFAPTLTPSGRLYMAGAGGTILYRDNVNSATAPPLVRIAFYGNANYSANTAAFNAGVKVCTPLTSDSQGNIFFGYRTEGDNPLGITSGLARVGANGAVSFVTAAAATGGTASRVVMNCAPAISNDGATVYVTMSNGSSHGSLVALNASTLATTASVPLKDAHSPTINAYLFDEGTASPVVAPDGKIFIGVLENPLVSSRGWTLQFNPNLTPSGAAGAFGWDDTPTVVPASQVASYTGKSPYLLMTKYNDYGIGNNRLAIVDPNDTFFDTRTNTTVMKEVISIAGQTPDPVLPRVREWCINTAVLDPFTHSVLANCEDGKLYRWSLTSNTFTEVITLTAGIGEAYTPTIIGADGKVYAINNATLYAIGFTPEQLPEMVALKAVLLNKNGSPWKLEVTLKNRSKVTTVKNLQINSIILSASNTLTKLPVTIPGVLPDSTVAQIFLFNKLKVQGVMKARVTGNYQTPRGTTRFSGTVTVEIK